MADRGVEIVCAGNPNFAVICDYLKRFSDILGLKKLPIATLERMLEDKKHVARDLIDLHVRLMRRLKKSVPYDRWEKFLIRVCNMYSELDAWDLHQFGYKCLNVVTRLRILKHLLELQFDENAKFKQEVNKMVASQMRTLSVGRDLNGLTYWYQQDPDCNVRVYREEQDDTEEGQSWTIVAREREELANLISKLEFNLQNPTLKDETRSNTPSEIGEPQRVQDLDSIKSEQHVDLKQGVHENGIDSRSIEEVKKEPDKTLSDKSGIIGKVKSEVDSGGSPQQDEKYLPCDKSVAPTHVKSPHEGDAQNVSSLSSTTELHEGVVVKSEPLCAESGGTEVASELAPAVTSFGDELSARLSASDEPVSVVDNETEKREAVTTATSERTDIVSEVGGTSVKEASAVCLVQGDAVTATDDSDANEMRIVAAKDPCDKQAAVCSYNSAGKTQSPCSVEGNQQLVVHNQSEQDAANETHGEVASDDSGKISIQAAVEDGPGKQPVKAVSDMEPGETCVRPASADENSEKPIQPVLGEGCGDEPESSNSLVKCEPGDKDVKRDKSVDESDKDDETVDKSDKGDETVDKSDKADETVDKRDKGDVNHDETFDKSDKDVEKCDKIVDESEKCVKEKDKGIDNIEKDLKKSDKGDKEHDENNKNVESGDKSESARDEIKDDNKNVDKNSKGDANGDNVDEKKTAGKAKPAGTLVKKGRKKKTDFLMPPELVDTPIRRSLRPRRQPPPPPVVEQILDSDELSDEEPKKNNKRKNKEDSDDEFVPTVSKSHRRKQLDSDMESEDEEGEVVAPKQRARTVKKTRDDGESDGEAEDDKPCTRCHEGDHPEWILLCDSCDAGYHTACLRPPLMDVPDGNWYCPPCEHKMLLEKLQEQLLDLDNELKEQDRLQKRQDRLDFVNVSLSNVLEKKRKHKRQRVMDSDEDDDENKENEEDEDQEEDGEDEEEDDDEEDSDEDTEWLRRSRRTRQEISYKFEEFDELIEDAVKDDIKEERVIPPGRNRGKDMTNITGLPPEDELPPVVARKGRHRRLTNLDASSETEEDAEDEEFKVTSEESSEKSEESPSMSEASDDSWAWRRRRRCPKPSRRSTRSAKGKRKKGFYRYKGDWVVDDEDSEASSDDYTTVRRRKVTKNVRYKEDSDTSSSASLPVHRRMTGKQRDTESGSWSGSGSNSDRVGARGVKRQKISSGKRKRIVVPQASDDDDDDDDDDVENHSNGGHAASSKRKLESDSDESGNKSGPSSACKRKNYRKVIGSESDDDSDVDDGKDSKGKSKVRAVNAKRSTRRASGHHVIESSDENDEDPCSQSRSSKSKTTKTSRVSHSETEEDSDDSGEEDPPTPKKDAKVKATAKRGTSRKDAQRKPSKKAETESKYEDEESNQSSEADDDDDDGDEDDDEEEEEEEEDENSDGDEEDKEEDEGNKPLSSKNKTQQLTPAKTSAMAKEGTKINPPNVGSQKSEEEVEGREVQAAIAVHDSDATIPCKSVPSQRSEIQSESGAEANTVSEQRQKGNKAETENAETVQKEVDCKTGLATVGINSVTAVESTPVELDEQRKRSETFPLKEPESTKVETVKAGKAGKIRKEGNDVTAQPMPTKTRAQQSRAAKKRGVLPTSPTPDVTQDTKTEADQSGEDNKEAVSDQDIVSPQVSQPVASNTCSGGMKEDQCKESALIPNSQDGKDERLPDTEKNPVLHELPSREPEDISRHSGSQQEPDEHTRDKTLSALEPPNDMPDGAHVPCKRVTKAGKAKRQRPPRKRGASKAAAAAAADSGNDVSEGSMNAPLGASRNAALEPRWIENELQGKSGGADYEAAVRDGRMDVQSREESREPSRDETRIAKDLDDNERRDSVGSDLQSGDELGARGENLGVPGTNMEAGAREMLPRGEKIGANPQGPPGSSLDRLQAHIEHVFQHEGPPPQLGRESGFPSQAYTRAEHPSMYPSKEDGNAFQHVGMGSEVAGVPLGPSGAFNGGARYYPGPMFQQRGPAPHGHFAHAGVPPYQVSHAGSPYQQGAPPYHGASTPPYPNASHYSPRPTAPPYQHGGGGGAAGGEAQFQRASPSYLQAHAHQYPQAAYGYPHGPHPGGQMAPMRHQASPTRGQASPPQRGSPTQQVSPPMRQSVIQPVPVRSSGAGFMIANILRDTRETLDPELSGDEAEPEYLEL
ncbi:PREDICTED: remodeling and spacing factor 1-like [Priapulus caudatus]|uniref:Remodeling and spacing factor 1-like n=1 Tax=Priapulus caudatus TaxID=37621 RepID=A0ABM1EK74_PRICU|nr:PREDICTED: remodeling and spacing factor 1-like [Priapulus caudatus]